MADNNQTNQDEINSYPIIQQGKLWVKLRIPRDDDEAEDHQIIGFHDDDNENDNCNKDLLRVCHICAKAFTSVKGLGGHMRVHVQRDEENKSQKPTCSVCFKEFRSMKSLYGHMRCHPDRDWRGIKPPGSEFGGHELGRTMENEELLKSWQVTAKRGRRISKTDKFPTLDDDDDHRKVDEENTSSDDYDGLGDGEFEDGELKVATEKKKRKKVSLRDLKSARKVIIPVRGSDSVVGESGGSVSNPTGEVITQNYTSKRTLDFDLNELPPSEDEALV